MTDKLLRGDKVVDLTPELIAELFADLDSTEQARFFNHVDECAQRWRLEPHNLGGFDFQLCYVTDDDGLTLAGRRIMQMIGEYSHYGLRTEAVYQEQDHE